MCLNVATSTCVAPTCDGAPRALGSLLFDFICHFLHIVGFPSPHPSPVPGWTGPVPGRAEWQHVGLSCQMPPTTAGLPVPPGCHLHGSGLLCSRLCRTAASSRGWELQCCLPGGGGGAQGCGWGRGTAVGRVVPWSYHSTSHFVHPRLAAGGLLSVHSVLLLISNLNLLLSHSTLQVGKLWAL